MNKKALSLAICVALAFPTVSNALSLGDIESTSSLNQPFKGRINLLSTNLAEAKTLRVRVASPEIFNRVGIDRPAFLNSIRFRTTVQNGRPVILVNSNQPINEPFLNFLLEVSWPNGQLLKEYTVLLDPPVLVRPDTAIASNTAGVRAEPRAQGRITRPVAQQQRRVVRQQPRRVVRAAPARRAAAPRRAPVRRAAPARRVAAVPRITNYRVRRGDTLSKVAAKLGYRGVRKDQMMMALFEKNRRAFSKNNINNLKSGALIKRPSLQEARAVNARAAKSQVIAQARAWKKAAAKQQIASNAAKSTTPKNTASAPKQAHLEVVGNKGSVKGSSSQGSDNVAVADLKKQLTVANESLTTRFKENEELKSRVSELESLLRKKNRLITLKSQQLAQLQQNVSGAPVESQPEVIVNDVAEAGTPVENIESPVEVTPTPAVNEGTDIQQEIASQLSQEQGEIIRDNSEQEAAIVSDVAAPAQSPFTEDAQVESESESTDFMGLLGSPVAMGIGGGSLLALFSLWYMRRRKANNTDYEEFSSIEIDDGLDADPIFEDENTDSESTTAIDESEFTSHDDGESEELEKSYEEYEEETTHVVDESEQDDILQEADVYIVYGLHDQAESELKRAIEKEPHNLAYRHKLLENYKAAGDKEAFEAEAKEFMAIDGDKKESFFEDVKEWGSSLIPDSNLFAGGIAAAGVAMVAGTASALSSDNAEITIDDELDSFDLDEVLSGEETYIDPDKLDETIDQDDEFMIDLDDDIEPITDIGKSTEMELDDIEDFDTELDDIEGLDDEAYLVEDELELDNSLELLTDSDEVSEIDTLLDEELATVSLDEDESSADFEVEGLSLDLDSDELEKILPEDSAYTAQSKDSSDSEEGESFEGYDSAEDNLLAEFDDNLSFLDLDDGDEVIEETQIETKLDLAKAYIDMGDIDGARSTLEEVMVDGSDEQKRQAEELLQQTG